MDPVVGLLLLVGYPLLQMPVILYLSRRFEVRGDPLAPRPAAGYGAGPRDDPVEDRAAASRTPGAVRCSRCGADNDPGFAYCRNCVVRLSRLRARSPGR